MSPFLVLSPLLLLLLSFFTYKLTLSRSKNKAKLPPSPPKIPLIGNLHQVGTLPHRSLCALSQKHGPLMLMKLGSVPTIVVSSSEMAQEIMKTQDHIFASRPTLEASRQLLYDSTDIAFAPYGEYWKQVKKISLLHLLSAKQVRSFRHVREEEVDLLIDKVKRESAKGPAVNLSRLLGCLMNDIVCRVSLGRKYYGEEDDNKYRKMIKENVALGGGFHVKDFFPYLGWVSILTGLDARIKRNFRNWDEFLNEVIADRLQRETDHTGHANDLLDILLSLRKDDSTEFTLTQDNIKAIIMDMFTAGTDSSHISTEWVMAELIRSPVNMKKVQEEIRRIVCGKAMVEEDDISQMLYLKAVIKEALRLHPPVPLLVPRESMKPTSIEDYDIPVKTRVIINAWAIGRNPNSWHMPEEFQPERFLDSHIDFKGHDFQYIPFGAGRRICPGISFASSAIELALANLLYHFDWRLPDGKSPEHLDMTEEFGLGVHMKSELLLSAYQMT